MGVKNTPKKTQIKSVGSGSAGSVPSPADEYMRRNREVAKVYGVKAEVTLTLSRLRGMKNPQKWLVASLAAMDERIGGIPYEMAKWRDSAPDNPFSQNISSQPPVFIVKAWGDEIPHATEQAALAEISECLQLGARSVSVEVRESPAPDNVSDQPRGGQS